MLQGARASNILKDSDTTDNLVMKAERNLLSRIIEQVTSRSKTSRETNFTQYDGREDLDNKYMDFLTPKAVYASTHRKKPIL